MITHITLEWWGPAMEMNNARSWYTPEHLCDLFNTEAQYGFGAKKWVKSFPAGASVQEKERQQIAVLLLCLPKLRGLSLETDHIPHFTGIGEVLTSPFSITGALWNTGGLSPPYEIIEKLLYNRIDRIDFGPASQSYDGRPEDGVDHFFNLRLFSNLKHVALPEQTPGIIILPPTGPVALLPPGVETLQLNQCQTLSPDLIRELQVTSRHPALRTVRLVCKLPASAWLARLIQSETSSIDAFFGSTRQFQRDSQALRDRKVTVETYFPSTCLELKKPHRSCFGSLAQQNDLIPCHLWTVPVRYNKINLMAALEELRGRSRTLNNTQQ
jgi:hypothetical protein